MKWLLLGFFLNAVALGAFVGMLHTLGDDVSWQLHAFAVANLCACLAVVVVMVSGHIAGRKS